MGLLVLLAIFSLALLYTTFQNSLNARPLIEIIQSRFFTSLVASPQHDYLETLRSKLGWGGLPSGQSK